jgi:hypothetical protein
MASPKSGLIQPRVEPAEAALRIRHDGLWRNQFQAPRKYLVDIPDLRRSTKPSAPKSTAPPPLLDTGLRSFTADTVTALRGGTTHFHVVGYPVMRTGRGLVLVLP